MTGETLQGCILLASRFWGDAETAAFLGVPTRTLPRVPA
jgi:hypothetical protein